MSANAMISPQKYFRLDDGRIIKNISELAAALENMNEAQYLIHVTSKKNDFADWVREVFGEFGLSNYLKEAKTKEEMIRILQAYLPKDMAQKIRIETKNSISPKEPSQKIRNVFSWSTKEKTLPESPDRHTNISETPQTKSLETRPEPVVQENVLSKQVPSQKSKESDADTYFREHPIIIDQIIESKKKDLSVDLLAFPSYTNIDSSEKLIDSFKETYVKAYERLIFLRKNGFDTKLCEIMLFRIPSKIKIFDATKEDKDAVQIKRYLNEVIEELNNQRT
ncbi:MAG: hypothetical protein ABIJ34_04075 [archaeon]